MASRPLPGQLAGLVENFLRMTFGLPAEPYEVDPVFVTPSTRCSSCTPTTSRTAPPPPSGWSARPRPTCSPASRPVSMPCSARCTAGPTRPCSTCWSTSRTPRQRRRFVERVKNKQDGVKLMGFGHRVYKNYDPRAAIVKKLADEILDRTGGDAAAGPRQAARGAGAVGRLLHPAQAVPERRLLHRAHLPGDGFPTRMSTVLFAIGRLPGWIAHWHGDDARPGHEDRPPAPGLHRPHAAATTARSAPANRCLTPTCAEPGAPRGSGRRGWNL